MRYSMVQITEGQKKRDCTEQILRALPGWFDVEEEITGYVEGVTDLPFWAAMDDSGNYLGFVAVKVHYGHTGDLYVLGVLREHHGQGIGKKLLDVADQYFSDQGCKYVIVKTLSDMVESEKYEKTRQFYRRVGFQPLITLTEMWDEDSPCLLMIKDLQAR